MSSSGPPRRWSWARTGAIAGLGLVPASAVAYAVGAWAPLPRMDRALVAGLGLFVAWSLVVVLLGARFIAVRGRRSGRGGPGMRPILLRLHLELGGALAFVAFVLCFSGAASVAARALAAWEQAPLLVREGPVPAAAEQPLDRLVDEALRDEPELAQGSLRLSPASEARPWVRMAMRGPGGLDRVQDFDPSSGQPLGRGRGPLMVLVELHRSLLVPGVVGALLVVSCGVLLVVVLGSGLATRRRWRREVFRLRARRRTLELHKLLGVWTFVFGIGAAWTGSIAGGTPVSLPLMASSAYDGDRDALIRDVLAVERVPFDPTAHPRPALTTQLEPACLARGPDQGAWSVERITLRHPGSASARTTVALHGPGPWLDEGLVVFDARGEVRTCRALRRQGEVLRLFYGAIALHFADFGGEGRWVIELSWILAGLGLAGGAIVGEVVRQRRLERAGRAVGRWARGALIGWGLGLPLAAVALLLLSRLDPEGARSPGVASIVFIGVWAGAWLWSTLCPTNAGLGARARRFAAWIGAGLVATAVSSIAVAPVSAVDLLWASMGAAILGGLRWWRAPRVSPEHEAGS